MTRDKTAITGKTHMLSRANTVRLAKDTVNKVIPDILRACPRARHGVHEARLFVNPTADATALISEAPSLPRIRLRNTDGLTAARQLTQYSRRSSLGEADKTPEQNIGAKVQVPNVCVLNMAHPTRIGGTFLDGRSSQEGFLCMRTTLYPSLWQESYPLPEVGGILTPDVLVIRDASPDANDLPKRERFYVDIITASMLRFPGAVNGRRLVEQEEDRAPCSCGVSYCDRDRSVVMQKMRGVLAMAQNRGAEKIVLGAWGCGTFGNPVREVAKLWRQVLLGSQNGNAVAWPGIKEVVFAIADRSNLKEFERCFSDVLVSASESYTSPEAREISPELEAENSANTSDRLTVLFVNIQETEIQLAQARNARTRARLRELLNNLNSELARVGSADSAADEVLLDEEDFVVDGYAVASDQEDGGYYHFDEDDIATSGSNSPASLYEFRVRPIDSQPSRRDLTASDVDVASSPPPPRSFAQDSLQRRRVEDSQGWFSGSITSLSSLLTKQRGAPGGSPVLDAQDPASEMSNLDLNAFMDRLPLQTD